MFGMRREREREEETVIGGDVLDILMPPMASMAGRGMHQEIGN